MYKKIAKDIYARVNRVNFIWSMSLLVKLLNNGKEFVFMEYIVLEVMEVKSWLQIREIEYDGKKIFFIVFV